MGDNVWGLTTYVLRKGAKFGGASLVSFSCPWSPLPTTIGMYDNRLERFQICNNFQCEPVDLYGILLLLDICSISLKSIYFQPINFQVVSLLCLSIGLNGPLRVSVFCEMSVGKRNSRLMEVVTSEVIFRKVCTLHLLQRN